MSGGACGKEEEEEEDGCRSVGGAPLPHVARKGGRRRRRSLALREGRREGAREEGGEETKMRGERRKGKGIRTGKGSKTQT